VNMQIYKSGRDDDTARVEDLSVSAVRERVANRPHTAVFDQQVRDLVDVLRGIDDPAAFD